MELSSIQHLDPVELTDFEADLFITVLSHESRCTHVARRLEALSIRKIALVKSGHPKEFAFQENHSYYTSHGFEIITIESGEPELGNLFGNQANEHLRVILDCTSLSPRWNYAFFNWFGDNQDEKSRATLRMVYMMAANNKQNQALKLKSVKSFLKKESGASQKKPTALIMGLGQEKGVSESIYNKIKPDLLYLYYADPPADKETVEQVFVNNHSVINRTPIRNLVAYPIRNGQIIYQSLIDTILPLRNEYSIVMVPHGPKFFSVVSMLVHFGYPDIQINYPKFKKSPSMDRTPHDEPIVLDVLFEGEE
jgi:hypothetical protein